MSENAANSATLLAIRPGQRRFFYPTSRFHFWPPYPFSFPPPGKPTGQNTSGKPWLSCFSSGNAQQHRAKTTVLNHGELRQQGFNHCRRPPHWRGPGGRWRRRDWATWARPPTTGQRRSFPDAGGGRENGNGRTFHRYYAWLVHLSSPAMYQLLGEALRPVFSSLSPYATSPLP